MTKKLPKSTSCHECGDLRLKYKNNSGKRRRYFCSEEHALQFLSKKLNRQQTKVRYTPKIIKSDKSYKTANFFEKIK